jgi:hypothetical protein
VNGARVARMLRASVAVPAAAGVLFSTTGIGVAKDGSQSAVHVQHRAAARTLQVSIDGTPLGAIGIAQGTETFVALAPVAVAAGSHIVRTRSGARVTGLDRSRLLTVGSRMIREDDDSEPVLRVPLADRDGALYVAADDAARLFDLHVQMEKNALAFSRPREIGSAPTVVEVPRPPAARPHATPLPSRMAVAEAASAGANAGRIVFSLERAGGLTQLMLLSETHGSYLHTYVSSAGIGSLGTPSATVTIGSATRNVALGALPNPIGGLIMRGGIYDGVALEDGYHEAFGGRRLDDGLDYTGVSSGDPLHGGSNTLAVVSQDGAYDQTIFRHYTVQQTPWGETAQELLVGDRGAGLAFSARTAGRTFLESDVAFVRGDLPLGPNDAPISIDLGRELSGATTVTAGFAKFAGQPISPFTGISMRARDLVASVSLTDRTVTTALAYRTATYNVQAFTVPGLQRTTGVQASALLPDATVDLSSLIANGERDDALEVRTTRSGLNLVAGVGDSNGKAGPIAGISIPLGSAFALETAIRPDHGSRRAIRFSLAMAVPGRRSRPLPTLPAAVRIDGTPANGKLRLFVDGMPVRTFAGTATTAPVTAGAHVFAVESVDGAAGSRDTNVTIVAAGDTVVLTLLPERAILGRVSLADPALVGNDFSLAGIPVVIEPGDIAVDTDADGTFVFPRQPIPSDATIAVDPGALPRTLRAPERVPLATGEMRIVLQPGLKIEEQTFR